MNDIDGMKVGSKIARRNVCPIGEVVMGDRATRTVPNRSRSDAKGAFSFPSKNRITPSSLPRSPKRPPKKVALRRQNTEVEQRLDEAVRFRRHHLHQPKNATVIDRLRRIAATECQPSLNHRRKRHRAKEDGSPKPFLKNSPRRKQTNRRPEHPARFLKTSSTATGLDT